MKSSLKIAWVTRSFLDYRIPVFKELDKLVDGNLYLIFSGDYVPRSVQQKSKNILGARAIEMHGEWKIGKEDRLFLANRNLSLRLQPGLIGKIREIQPDVLVCEGFFKWTLSALIYKLIYRVPLVINYERTFHTERKAQWYRTLYRKCMICLTDSLNCSGKLCENYVKWLGVKSETIFTGHMVADTEELSNKSKAVKYENIEKLKQIYGIQGIILTYVGRLHPLKGCYQLLDAWKDIHESHHNELTLLFVGSGEEEEALKDEVNRFNLSNVKFIGAIPYDEIHTYYSLSDVLILPTLEDNWSLVVAEAMACGLPILTSKYNGCWPDLVIDDRNGWLFDPLIKEEIISVVEKCIKNKNKLPAMGEESKKIIENYSPLTAAKSILEACNYAISRLKK